MGKKCDIVMKGGVTSGIVYPRAVETLSRTYTFKNIGGTSAGAIAAAATAAAEFQRRTSPQSTAGFSRLRELPENLAQTTGLREKTTLYSLFQPLPKLKPVFDALVCLTDKRRSLLSKLLGAVFCFWLWPLVGTIGVVVTGRWFLQFHNMSSPDFVVFSLGGACVLIVFWVVIPILACITRLIIYLPGNGYGLCSGIKQDSGPSEALTPWLDSLLNHIAGKPPADGPLTFEDLWGTADFDPDSPPTSTEWINLQMLATNLTHGRPYRLPFREDEVFYFSRSELNTLFPVEVVNWMVNNSPKRQPFALAEDKILYRLPPPGKLPVVFAVRISMSFPLLLSAVPLYAEDTTLDKEKYPKPEDRLKKCWFSDGGICSNFPLHFFDSPIPEWPTFALNLKKPHPDYPIVAPSDPNYVRNRIYAITRRDRGQSEVWNRFEAEAKSSSDRVTGFFAAVFESMQNWRDKTQTKVPGFRDRVVHISLKDNEGGLNLNMPKKVVLELSQCGEFAATKLMEIFTKQTINSTDTSWAYHRMVRYRTFVAALQKKLNQFTDVLSKPQPGDTPLPQLIQDVSSPSDVYFSSQDQRADALEQTKHLNKLAANWVTASDTRSGFPFVAGAPDPQPLLRLTPDL